MEPTIWKNVLNEKKKTSKQQTSYDLYSFQ